MKHAGVCRAKSFRCTCKWNRRRMYQYPTLNGKKAGPSAEPRGGLTKKKEKSWNPGNKNNKLYYPVEKGLDSRAASYKDSANTDYGYCHPSNRSAVPIPQKSYSSSSAVCLCKGGWSKPPRSPLEAPTVRQGAQRTLVKAFQESGSGEGGGEAEGGLPLWNAACSGHVTGRAQRETATSKIENKK